MNMSYCVQTIPKQALPYNMSLMFLFWKNLIRFSYNESSLSESFAYW